MEAARAEQPSATRASSARVARTAAAAPLHSGAGASAVLALQRSAGNAATGASLRRTGVLARCGAGGCTCGGACGGHGKSAEVEELELQRTAADGRQALARAVRTRRATS